MVYHQHQIKERHIEKENRGITWYGEVGDGYGDAGQGQHQSHPQVQNQSHHQVQNQDHPHHTSIVYFQVFGQ